MSGLRWDTHTQREGNRGPKETGGSLSRDSPLESKPIKQTVRRDIETSEPEDASVEHEMKGMSVQDLKVVEKRLSAKEISLNERENAFVVREREFNRVVDSWTKKFNESEERIKRLDEKETELSVSISNKERYLSDLNHRITEGEKQILVVQQEIARIEYDERDKKMSIDESQADISIKERRIKELDKVMSDLGTVVEDLQVRIKDDKMSLSVLEGDIRSAERAYGERKDAMKKITQELNEKRKHAEKLEELIVDHEDEIEELKKEVEKLAKKRDDTKRPIGKKDG